MRHLGLVCAGVLASLVLVWSLGLGRRLDEENEVSGVGASAEESARSAAQEASGLEPVPRSGKTRVAAEEGAASGRVGMVVSSEGQPVPGAEVRWVALEPEDGEPTPAWPGGGYGIAKRSEVATVTDADGRFLFEAPPNQELPFGSALIATHQGHAPGGLDLAPRQVGWDAPVELRLGAALFLEVQVVDPDGRGVSGASIHQEARIRGVPGEAAFSRQLSARARSDASGRARLAAFPGGQVVWAVEGSRSSARWRGDGPARFTLVVEPAAQVGGALSIASWESWDPLWSGERRVIVSGRKNGYWRELAVLRDVNGTEWGPVPIPVDGLDRVRVRLEGIPLVPVSAEVASPLPGETVRIDLAAEVGEHGLWLFVQDEEERPILDARATAWWEELDHPGELAFVQSSSRPDGGLYLGTFPKFPVRYLVEAPGYCTVTDLTGGPLDHALPVTLQRAATVSGRVRLDGSPVEDFEVLRWQPSTAGNVLRRAFLGSTEGKFELADVAPGSWVFQATSAAHPAGAPVVVRVEEGMQEIELTLARGFPGHGSVLDAETSEPLPDARVQLFTSSGSRPTAPFGEARRVGMDGGFEVEGCVEGQNFLRVDCSGYARTEVNAHAGEGPTVDFGEIRLHRPQALTLSVLGAEVLSPAQLASFHVHDAAAALGSERSFDAEGVVVFPEVPPGQHRLLIEGPDRPWIRMHLDCAAGTPWSFQVKLAGEQALEVLVLDEEGEAPSFEPEVFVTTIEEGIRVVRAATQQATTPVRFEGLRAERASVLVVRGSDTLASRVVQLGPGAMNSLTIRLDEKPLRARVVDVRGEPVAGAWLSLFEPGESIPAAVDDSGADGWCELYGVPRAALLADLTHGSGVRLAVPFDGRASDQELVLEVSCALELFVHDAGAALSGAELRLESAASGGAPRSRATGSDGAVRYEGLGPGRYRIVARKAGHWSVVLERELGDEEAARVELELRRLGTLELQAFGPQGERLAGTGVELECADLGESVADWIRSGRLESPAPLVTDREGRLTVEGLPRGRYLWRTELGQGAFELEGGTITRVEARAR